MVDENDGAKKESRPPRVEDLLRVCHALNEAGARYIVVGGMAVIQAGFVRATEDIDLLVEASADNHARLRKALMVLPDGAITEVKPDDLERYTVVKVADEIVIDLMKSACGIEYDEAAPGIHKVAIQGVMIPFAGAELLWKLKQTGREKDELDRLFLAELLKK